MVLLLSATAWHAGNESGEGAQLVFLVAAAVPVFCLGPTPSSGGGSEGLPHGRACSSPQH